MIWFVRHERNPGVPIVPAMKTIDWDKRIQRAVELGERYPSAAEILGFYRHILEFQKTLYADVSSVSPSSAGVKAALGTVRVVRAFRPALSAVNRPGGVEFSCSLLKEARDERSRHITNPANLGPSWTGRRRGHAAPGQGVQAHRHHHLHRLQSLRSGLCRMERHAVPDDLLRQHLPDDAGH